VTQVGWQIYVEEDEEEEGPDAPVQGESRQAPQHGARLSRIVEFVVGGDVDPWTRLGLRLQPDATSVIGSVRLRVDPSCQPGLHTVGLLDVTTDDIDGAPVHLAAPPQPSSPDEHELGATSFDHVVLMTPDLERTCAAVTAATAAPLKRTRQAGPARQGFFRLGEVILELVQPPQPGNGPATWWGLVIVVADVVAACERLGPDVIGAAKAAVQPGRFIATVRDDAGFGLPLALMSR